LHSLPGPLRLPRPSPFVGRFAELAALNALVTRAAGEGRHLALRGGEAGSGKSRLVREVARHAAPSGVLVLYGACDAVVQTPYRPFVEALDQLVRATDPDVLRDELGATGGELTRLLPDLPRRVEGLAPPLSADPDTERHRLHTAVSDILVGAGRRQPVLLVLEDVHWADSATLVLLRHLARPAMESRLLVLTTFRDTEAEVPPQLADSLADLRRSEDVLRLHLAGLTEDDVTEFVRLSGDGDAECIEPDLPAAIRELTDGNPFLLCELWRTLVETGSLAHDGGALHLTRPLSEIATPDSVREVTAQRLARLGPGTGELLELFAVAGPEFELDVLRDAAPGGPERFSALELAVRSGIIEELAAGSLAYRFTHELVRRALYDRLSVVRRAELHLRIAQALEASGPPYENRVLADLAHHYAAAAPLHGPAKAMEYNLQAAAAASAVLAYQEATERLQTALAIGLTDERQRAEVLLDLGRTMFRAGMSLDSLAVLRQAAEIARRRGDGELLARVAIAFETSCWRPGINDQGARELLEEASRSLSSEDSQLRVGVLGGLARAFEFQGRSVEAEPARDAAIAMARRIGDQRGLAEVLMGAYWARATTSLPRILRMLGEAAALAGELGEIEIQAEAMEWRVAALIAMGELATASRELAETQRMAEHTRQPFILHVVEHYRSAVALLEGRLAEAEQAAERSREWGRLLLGRDASGVYGIQMFGVRREQGRLAELAPLMRILAGDQRDAGPWRPGLAALLSELGMEREVRRELDRVCAEGLEPLRESMWLASLTFLADAAAAVGHRPAAALVLAELAPLAGTNVMIGHGVACYGAADRYLGMLAATIGDTDGAGRHFEAALRLNRWMGARTWLAHTAHEYGRILRNTGDVRAGALLAQAAGLAEAIGMPVLLGRVRALTEAPGPGPPDGLSDREVDVLRCVARGLSNREIGAELFISEHTVANHVRSILRKTQSANRTEATAYAYRRDLAQS
jgi:DNA-binding CsgD family transcriptional regulator/tetratricopeptide (TPR) repeat protein